jgi:hypothetical protein
MGTQSLATAILSRALNDICPDYSHLPAKERKRKIKKRKEFYKKIEKAFDEEWASLEDWALKEKLLRERERENAFENIKRSKNIERIPIRLQKAEQSWEGKFKRLRNRFMIKETGYNIRRNQRDRIRASLQWFIEDSDQVLHLCRVSGLDVKNCYYIVRERLHAIGRRSKPLEELIKKIENHEY